jgi:hypothetical protein
VPILNGENIGEVLDFFSTESFRIFQIKVCKTIFKAAVEGSVKSDGACSLRALYILYLDAFPCEGYKPTDPTLTNAKSFRHFKFIMNLIREQIPSHDSNIELLEKFDNIFHAVVEREESKVASQIIPSSLWLTGSHLSAILSFINIEVAVFESISKKQPDLSLTAWTPIYTKWVDWSLPVLQSAMKAPRQLILSCNHFSVNLGEVESLSSDLVQTSNNFAQDLVKISKQVS